MKVCFPIEQDRGMESLPYAHFGSAPYFLVYDTESRQAKTIDNRDEHHAHGACNPLKALAGDTVDALVVGGIGSRAIAGLNRLGIKVYRATPGTIRENIARLEKKELVEWAPDDGCGQRHHGCK
jgi:predicted Fe-Mo cluster-binding NifX family protein